MEQVCQFSTSVYQVGNPVVEDIEHDRVNEMASHSKILSR